MRKMEGADAPFFRLPHIEKGEGGDEGQQRSLNHAYQMFVACGVFDGMEQHLAHHAAHRSADA